MLRRFSNGSLRLLWDLVKQGYEVQFEVQGEEILCHLRHGEKKHEAISNNASSALYIAWTLCRLASELERIPLG